MGAAEVAVKLVAAGAIGVAVYALYVWHSAYRDLLEATKSGNATTLVVERLASQLQHYSKLALLTLISAIALQIVELVIDRVWPRTMAHSIRVNVTPDDIWAETKKPTVNLNGKPMTTVGLGSFEDPIQSASNLEVSMLSIRDALQEERRNASRAISEQAKLAAERSKPVDSTTASPPVGF